MTMPTPKIALAAMKQRGWDQYNISLRSAKEGFTFSADDPAARRFLIQELGDNFDASANKFYFDSHIDQADCNNGDCVDYRSNDGVIQSGRMQVVYNSSKLGATWILIATPPMERGLAVF